MLINQKLTYKLFNKSDLQTKSNLQMFKINKN